MPQAILSAQTADTTVKFLATTVGRDRINRFTQYFSRFLVWYGLRNGFEKTTVERLQRIMSLAGQTRKAMRIGRQIEFVRAIMKASSMRDAVVGLTVMVKNAFLSLWLVADTIQLLNNTKILQNDNLKEIVRRGQKCWLLALTASLIGGLHKLRMNNLRLEHESKVYAASQQKGVADETAYRGVKTLKAERGKLVKSFIQDSLDIMIPASSLQYINLESGTVGLIGAITSIMGGVTHWKTLV